MKRHAKKAPEKGKTQAYNRKKNNSLVLSVLKESPSSGTMLSERLGLSNSALSGILTDLKSSGLIVEQSRRTTNGKGRKQVLFEVNGNFGLIVVVSIANYMAKIVVANIKKEILATADMEVGRYDVKAVYDIVCSIYSMLMQDQFRSIPLKEIVISWPGRVNALNGSLAVSPQFDPNLFADKNFLVHEFSKRFPGARISVNNDIKFAVVGERDEGSLSGLENAMLLSVDTGIGGALLIKGSPFQGEQGYAGEFGLLRAEFQGKAQVLDEVASLRALKLHFEKPHFSEVVELYRNDPEAKSYVLKTGEAVGKVLSDCAAFLDVTRIVVLGRCREFGQEYLDAIKTQFRDPCYVPDLSYSTLEDPVLLGGVNFGVYQALKEALE